MNIETGKHNKYYLKDNPKAFFYPEEWMKIMAAAKPRQALTANILINTGARINEARHIKVEDIVWDKRVLILRVTKVRAKFGEKRPVPRPFSISSTFCKDLKKYIRKYKLAPHDYFPMLKPNATNSFIKLAAKKIGRKDWKDFSPHNIRKTFESWLIALRVPIFNIVKHLGHTQAVAAKSYVGADLFTPQDKILIRDILDDLYVEDRRY